jgi:hypothetical protein
MYASYVPGSTISLSCRERNAPKGTYFRIDRNARLRPYVRVATVAAGAM